jgi:hypothetical protein
MPDKNPFPTGTAISAGAGIIGGLINARANRRAQDRAFNQNRQFWREKFNTEASYNHPAQQMARMKEAGLNPALMYKTGSGASGSTSSPSSQGKVAERYDLGQLAAQSAQVANIVANTAKTKVETTLLGANVTGKQTSNRTAEITEAMKTIELSSYSDKVKAEVDKALANADEAITNANSSREKLDAWRTVYKTAAANGMDLTQGPMKIMLQGTVNKFFKTTEEIKNFLLSLGLQMPSINTFLKQ